MKSKIVIGTIISVVLLIVAYIILVLTGLFPNPFLDTKDLICRFDNFYPVGDVDVIMTFRFDKKAKIKSYTESYVYVIEDEEHLKQIEEELISENEKFTIDGNELITYTDFYIKKDIGYYGKTKKEIKKIYSEEFFYTCE